MTGDDPLFAAARARIGKPLNAKWTIDELIGVGGMATVFAATHRNRSRGALKLLHAEVAADRTMRERFLREGRIANRVEHPARVAVIDDDVSDGGEPFLVMELLVGATLAERLRARGGTLPLEETLAIFDVVLDLLAACSAVQVVHRDIKPGNVFLESAGAVRVLDFGVARLRDRDGAEATRAGTALGTPSFMSPEQALGQEGIDGRADLFSVGACIYTCLTGERLHAAESETEAYVKSATQAATSIARAAPDLPAPIVAFVDRALAFDRKRRFADAPAMRAELLTLLADVRAGKLARGAAKKATGLVVRGDAASELLERGERGERAERAGRGDPEERGERAAPAPSADKTRERLASMFKALGNAITAIRQYGWVHPTSSKGLSIAFDEIGAALAQDPVGLRWDVTPSAFTFEEVPVWSPDRPPLDRIPYALFGDGIRRIQLKPGLDLDELRDFLAIVMRDEGDTGGAAGAGEEDDSVTVLWDRRFHHIAYFAIDSFAEGDETQRGQFEATSADLAEKVAALSHLDRDWDEGALEARAAASALAGLASLDQVRDAAVALSLDALTRATLAAQIAPSADAWSERYVDAFVDAWREGVRGEDLDVLADALREWAKDQIALHAYEATFRTYGALARAFGDVAEPQVAKALERKLAGIMFPLDALRAMLADLARGAHGVDEAMARGIARALAVLDRDAVFGVALECFEASSDEPLRNVLLGYLKRWLPGHEGELELILLRAAPKTAIPLLRLLASLAAPSAGGAAGAAGAPDAQVLEAVTKAIEPGLASPHLEVRLEALARLPDPSGERLREELGRLLDDKDPHARARTMQLVVQMALAAAGPVLAMRVQQPEFHGHPLDERRALLETVWRLNPRRGEALALELLEERRLVATRAIDESRVLAAETLAKAGTSDSLAALVAVSKSRWFASSGLRDAAAKAIEAIKARLAGARGGAP